MKIGIDARLWNETGVGRYIRNLVENLLEIDSRNEYVLFVGSKTARELKTQIANLKITSKNLKLVETDIRWHTIKEQRLFPRILEKEHLDLVHFPYFSVPIFYKNPYVITIHDLIIHHYPTGKASTLPSPVYYMKLFGYKYVIKEAAQKAQKIITVSQATKSEIVKHLSVSPDKITVTYEGVDGKVANSKQLVASKHNSGNYQLSATNYFLYVGNAYPHKNLDRMIEAFKLIGAEFPDIKLVLVGKDDYFYQRLREKVQKSGIEKFVIFAGFVAEEELQNYYENAKAVILPSLMEGFGLTGLEAMQNNCLVIASDIPTLREIYKDAAVYFDPLAIESLHATIREVLLAEKRFKEYIIRGKKRVSEFSWRKMAQQTLKIYESTTSTSSV